MALAPARGDVNWDPFQREALAELGHRLYRLRAGEARAPLESVEPVAPAGTIDPLFRAVMRAAGTAALPQLELETLRGDPAAKRALWPRLRALRGAARAR